MLIKFSFLVLSLTSLSTRNVEGGTVYGDQKKDVENQRIANKKCSEYNPPGLDDHPTSLIPELINHREYPHLGFLGYGNESATLWLCGASLISENYVLTAAHCLLSRDHGKPNWVHLGEFKKGSPIAKEQIFEIIETILHPSFSPRSQYNDIALIKIKRTGAITPFIRPICVYDKEISADEYLVEVGWERKDFDPEQDGNTIFITSLSQKKCDVEKINKTISSRKLNKGIDIEIQICAGSDENNCKILSGGSVLAKANNRNYLVGISSLGLGCFGTESISVSTRVLHYLDWIENIVWPKS